jgi:hypothetical protein
MSTLTLTTRSPRRVSAAAAVGVVHLHSAVGDGGRADEDQAVRANGGAPRADALRERGGIGDAVGEAVDVDVVVADAVHLDERKDRHRCR